MSARLGTLAVFLSASSAFAQPIVEPTLPVGFDVTPFRSTGESNGTLTLWTASVPPHLEWSAGAAFDIGFSSVRLAVPEMDLPERDVVRWRGDLHLAGLVGLFDVATVGAEIPIVMFQQGLTSPFAKQVVGHGDLASGRMGDIALFGEYRLLAQKGALPAMSVGLRLQLPTGAPNDLAGERGGIIEPIGTFTYSFGPHSITGNVSWRARTEPIRVRNSQIGHHLAWGIGGQYALAIPPLAEPQVAVAEIVGLLPLFDHNGPGNHLSLEARIAIIQSFMTGAESSVNVTLGVGAGIVREPGTPLIRMFTAIGFTSEHPYIDDDSDGIPNRQDACPRDEEDYDEFEDNDGCPEFDNDQDGLDDVEDDCPDQAEDVDDVDDWDGCPDPDIPDDDKDGLLGDNDRCPDEAEDWDGFEDDDGCPEPDNDGDGLDDISDLCPDAAEDRNRYQDDDGCPDRGRGARFFTIKNERVQLYRPILFERQTATLVKRSLPVLDQLSSLMRSRADIVRFYINIYPDKRARRWRELAAERAMVLRNEMLRRGVEEWRMRFRAGSWDKRSAGKMEMTIEIDKNALRAPKKRKPTKRKKRRRKRR